MPGRSDLVEIRNLKGRDTFHRWCIPGVPIYHLELPIVVLAAAELVEQD